MVRQAALLAIASLDPGGYMAVSVYPENTYSIWGLEIEGAGIDKFPPPPKVRAA